MSFPSLPEQEKIAHFLTLLDEKIESETVILNNYEQQKKYFLQNMLI
ncbi:hypothetical protein ['Camptotheca acuminata' phytoplasma]